MEDRLLGILNYCNNKKYYPYKKRVRVYLYLIKCGEYFKIGYASNVKKRFDSYCVHNPYECNLLLSSQEMSSSKAIQIEQEILLIYRSKHHKGEWFIFDDDDVKLISEEYFNLM